MDSSDIFRHAINIADFMRTVSEFVTQGEWPDEQQMRERKYQTVDQFHRHHDEFGDPIDLDDLGLDDMSLSRIVIELSQTREHFKVWTPFNEDFRVAIKQVIPPRARRWDPDERCWRVDCYWFGNAQELLPDHFPDLERYYTERAIRMCEQLSREGEEEEEEEEARKKAKRKARQRKATPGTKKKSKAQSRYKKGSTKKKAPPPPEDDYEWDEPEPPQDDPYEILGVSRKAPDEVIKAAHKALARKYHTDATGKDSDKDMKKVNAAFERIKELRKWNTKQQSST